MLRDKAPTDLVLNRQIEKVGGAGIEKKKRRRGNCVSRSAFCGFFLEARHKT